jgi:hypothetical protein
MTPIVSSADIASVCVGMDDAVMTTKATRKLMIQWFKDLNSVYVPILTKSHVASYYLVDA